MKPSPSNDPNPRQRLPLEPPTADEQALSRALHAIAAGERVDRTALHAALAEQSGDAATPPSALPTAARRRFPWGTAIAMAALAATVAVAVVLIGSPDQGGPDRVANAPATIDASPPSVRPPSNMTRVVDETGRLAYELPAEQPNAWHARQFRYVVPIQRDGQLYLVDLAPTVVVPLEGTRY